jgi:hypothetical protein
LANNTLEFSDLVTDNSITVSEGEQRKGAFSHYFYYKAGILEGDISTDQQEQINVLHSNQRILKSS